MGFGRRRDGRGTGRRREGAREGEGARHRGTRKEEGGGGRARREEGRTGGRERGDGARRRRRRRRRRGRGARQTKNCAHLEIVVVEREWRERWHAGRRVEVVVDLHHRDRLLCRCGRLLRDLLHDDIL